jgi:endonuclease YncB( thermonuclease family)
MAERRIQALIEDVTSKFHLERRQPGKLRLDEVYWRDLQPWLVESGYMLRPRYRPDWVPSWTNNKRNWRDLEDEQEARVGLSVIHQLYHKLTWCV